jgi:hypothetical protein
MRNVKNIRKRNIQNVGSINLENLKDLALKRGTAKTYFAIGLLVISLLAAFAITGKANRSVSVWSANGNLASGDLVNSRNIKEIKVFLPTSANRYFSGNSKIINLVATRSVSSGELIPTSALTANSRGERIRSVPLKIARNDLPSDLESGQNVDIYSLPLPDLNSQKDRKTELISERVNVESIDLKSKDMGGDIGIVLKIPESDVINLLATLNNSRIVVVRNAL